MVALRCLHVPLGLLYGRERMLWELQEWRGWTSDGRRLEKGLQVDGCAAIFGAKGWGPFCLGGGSLLVHNGEPKQRTGVCTRPLLSVLGKSIVYRVHRGL